MLHSEHAFLPPFLLFNRIQISFSFSLPSTYIPKEAACLQVGFQGRFHWSKAIMVVPFPRPRRHGQSLLVGFWEKIALSLEKPQGRESSSSASEHCIHDSQKCCFHLEQSMRGESLRKRDTQQRALARPSQRRGPAPEHAVHGQVLLCYVRQHTPTWFKQLTQGFQLFAATISPHISCSDACIGK